MQSEGRVGGVPPTAPDCVMVLHRQPSSRISPFESLAGDRRRELSLTDAAFAVWRRF
jgi:hypothetical protein